MRDRSGRKNWSSADRQGLSNTSNRFGGEIVTPSVGAVKKVSDPIVAVFKNPLTGEDIPLTQSQLDSLQYRTPSMAQQMAETPGVGVSMSFDKAKEILERQKASGAIQTRNSGPVIVESTGREDYSRFGSTGEIPVGSSQQINENLANVLNQRVPTYIEGNERTGGMVGYNLPTVERFDEDPVEFLATIPSNTIATDVDINPVPLEDVEYVYDPVAEGDIDAPRTGNTPGLYSDEVVPEIDVVTVKQGTPSSILEAVISPTTKKEGITLKVGPEEGVYRFDPITGKPVKVSETQLEQEKQAFWDKIRSGGADEVSLGIPISKDTQIAIEEGKKKGARRLMRGSTVINELQRKAMRQAYNQATRNELEFYLQGLKKIRERKLEDEQRFILDHEYGLNIDELKREPPTISAVPSNPAAIYDTETIQPRMTPQEAGEQRILDMLREDAISRTEGLEAGIDSYGPIMGRNAGGAMNLENIVEPAGNWAGDLLRDNRVRLGLAGLGGVGLIGLIANRIGNNREERRQAAANSLNYPPMTGY
jgi:hypothetical protein